MTAVLGFAIITPPEAIDCGLVEGQGVSSASEPLPRHLLGWFPYLWSRVLFPGQSAGDSTLRQSSLLWLLILPALLLYPTRDFLLLEPDEGRYAQIPREMLAAGDWVVPVLQGEPYLDKPPLFYWLVMLAYHLFGVADSVARIVPALAVHATILCVYLIGRRSMGERTAFWGALLLTLMPGFIGMGRLLLLDGLLTFCITLMLLSVFEAIRTERFRWGWWLLSAVACGFGVLTKGPVALIMLLPPVLAWCWLCSRSVAFTLPRLAAYLGMVLAINLPWYVAIYLREPVFLRYFFWEHNVLRFASPFDHLQPVWYYLPIALGSMLPASLLLLPLFRYFTTGEEGVTRQRSPELSFWLLAGGWCLLFFSLSGSKLPTYILPAFPLLALVLGYYIVHSRWLHSAWTRTALVSTGAVLLLTVYIGIPWYARERSPLGRPELVLRHVRDPEQAVVCYPRQVNSVAFYLGRSDFQNYRSKETQDLILSLLTRPRTVILLTHRHSIEALRHCLPEDLLQISESVSLKKEYPNWPFLEKVLGDTPWGLCDIAVVEIRALARQSEQARR